MGVLWLQYLKYSPPPMISYTINTLFFNKCIAIWYYITYTVCNHLTYQPSYMNYIKAKISALLLYSQQEELPRFPRLGTKELELEVSKGKFLCSSWFQHKVLMITWIWEQRTTSKTTRVRSFPSTAANSDQTEETKTCWALVIWAVELEHDE